MAGDGTAQTSDLDLGPTRRPPRPPSPTTSTPTPPRRRGRSALAGLDAVDSPAGTPVWVFSPLLDTEDPADFRELAFDESPASVVKAAKKAKTLPDLKGREVTFVVTPVAGAAAAAVQAPDRLPAGGLGGPGQGGRGQAGHLLRRHRYDAGHRHEHRGPRTRSQRRLRLGGSGQDAHLHAAVAGAVRRRPAGPDRQDGDPEGAEEVRRRPRLEHQDHRRGPHRRQRREQQRLRATTCRPSGPPRSPPC